MTETATDYRKYLQPKMLAKISSLDLRARLIVEGLTSGMHRSPYQGISIEFAQHRQYVQGDDIRHVDWKVLAKTDKIYLKQYLEETNLQLICVVDASESMAFGTVKADDGTEWSKYDHATAIAASLSYLTIQQQDSVGLAIFEQALSRYFKPSNSPGQWKLITQELQQVPRLSKTNTGKILSQLAEKLHHRSLIVILSDLFDDLDSLKKGLRHLHYKKHEMIVFQILDPAEIHFPFNDMTMFKGLEDSGQLLAEPRASAGLSGTASNDDGGIAENLPRNANRFHQNQFRRIIGHQSQRIFGHPGNLYQMMLSFSFLALGFMVPAFAIAGLALAALPIVIHFLNRRRYRTTTWAAMDLLLRAIQKNRRRSRFENWLLLATRCLVMVLIGLALARPIGCDNQSGASIGGRTGLHVIVIDNSYSMSYLAGRPGGKTHLDQAKVIAGQIIDHLMQVVNPSSSSPPVNQQQPSFPNQATIFSNPRLV